MKLWITSFILFSSILGYGQVKDPLKELMEGNKRYIEDRSTHPNRNQERRSKVAAKQFPFAIIVSCSDSRVAPEILFDQGVGDLFVVRVAGNVIGPLELDSIEYAALHLGSSLVLVMGHKNCGAVDAVIQGTTDDIESIAQLIEPAVKQARAEGNKNLLERAIKLNAEEMAEFVKKSSAIKKKNIKVKAAYYNLETGEVQLLPTK